MPLARVFDLSLQKQFFPDPRINHFKPFTVLNRTVSSKRGSLGEGLWDAFLTNRSQTIFSGPPRYPLYAVYSFEQTVPSKRGSLGEGPWDAFLINRSKSKDPVYLNEVCLNPVYMMPSVWIHSVWMLSLRLWSVWRFTVCLPAVRICPRNSGPNQPQRKTFLLICTCYFKFCTKSAPDLFPEVLDQMRPRICPRTPGSRHRRSLTQHTDRQAAYGQTAYRRRASTKTGSRQTAQRTLNLLNL